MNQSHRRLQSRRGFKLMAVRTPLPRLGGRIVKNQQKKNAVHPPGTRFCDVGLSEDNRRGIRKVCAILRSSQKRLEATNRRLGNGLAGRPAGGDYNPNTS